MELYEFGHVAHHLFSALCLADLEPQFSDVFLNHVGYNYPLCVLASNTAQNVGDYHLAATFAAAGLKIHHQNPYKLFWAQMTLSTVLARLAT